MRAENGSILIEHLMAFLVLGILVAGVFNLLAVGQFSRLLGRDLSLAASLAQRKIEEVTAADYDAITSAPREPVGSVSPGYSWEVDVAEQAAGLKQVTATVSWRSHSRLRSVRLVTLVRRP